MLNIILRSLTLLLQATRFIYWLVAEKQANREKPMKHKPTFMNYFQQLLFGTALGVMIVQLLGFDILSFPHNTLIQFFGFTLSLIGISTSMLGRREIGTNWIHGTNYQIKQNQELITSGIYKYIRHPIYSGLYIAYIGGELVAESYLVFFYLVVCFLGFYLHIKREEKILLQHFGKDYEHYMHHTKMLIPYIL